MSGFNNVTSCGKCERNVHNPRVDVVVIGHLLHLSQVDEAGFMYLYIVEGKKRRS